MNKKTTFKQYFTVFTFLLFATLSHACITSLTISTDGFVDNGDGTCTYDVTITIKHTEAAVSIQMQAIGGTFDSCDGGGCTNVPTDPSGTTTFPAVITKDCDNDIDVFARGRDATGFSCGSLGVRFTGIDGGLPVEMASFTADQDSRSNILSWETSSEENTLAFLIQRSYDGSTDFETIGRVEAVGNSSVLQSYEFSDKDPLSLAYYRLQIVDYDGSFEFSDVLVIERARTEIDIVEVYPVPVIDNEVTVLVHSKKAGAVFIDLFDMNGRSIKQDRIELKEGINRLLIDWESNEGNMYFFTIYNGTERISKKILKANLD